MNGLNAYLKAAEAPGDIWQQERQVRLTAQRILADHLCDERAEEQRSTDPPSPRFWPGIQLDLAGATLIDFSLQGGVIAGARFEGATFSGRAMFWKATFSGRAGFDWATFNHLAVFDGVTFSGDAGFGEAIFSSGVTFTGATFSTHAIFDKATFNDLPAFVRATFGGDTRFVGATFSDDARFDKAAFSGRARFSMATFSSGAVFDGAAFSGNAGFDRVTFNGDAVFDGATFSSGEGGVSFARSRVLSPHAQHVWPRGWRLEPDGSGGYTVVRADDAGRSLPTRPCAPRSGSVPRPGSLRAARPGG